MGKLAIELRGLDVTAGRQKEDVVAEIVQKVEAAGYTIVEVNDHKPWGAYLRMDDAQADRFVEEFFPGLSPQEARLGIVSAELSPKFLIVSPNERLSWQKHDRRAERWTFLTPGAYNKSFTDDQGEMRRATKGDTVQFERGECHRLNGLPSQYVVVAEIWQHSDPTHPSDEDDITRLQDDYKR